MLQPADGVLERRRIETHVVDPAVLAAGEEAGTL
jgi:hypothetical protein